MKLNPSLLLWNNWCELSYPMILISFIHSIFPWLQRQAPLQILPSKIRSFKLAVVRYLSIHACLHILLNTTQPLLLLQSIYFLCGNMPRYLPMQSHPQSIYTNNYPVVLWLLAKSKRPSLNIQTPLLILEGQEDHAGDTLKMLCRTGVLGSSILQTPTIHTAAGRWKIKYKMCFRRNCMILSWEIGWVCSIFCLFLDEFWCNALFWFQTRLDCEWWPQAQ